MSSIERIDPTSVRKICSGQVVVDVGTAIKELVENALDAGATQVEVKLIEHGTALIEVSDNGSGIAECDFEGIARRHATSKLRDIDDLSAVSSFGFRGEAVASLCELSGRVEVTTRHRSARAATRLRFGRDGSIVERQSPTARAVGTTVSVSELFKPLPVRRADLERHAKRHFAKALRALHAYALVARGTRLRVTNASRCAKSSKPAPVVLQARAGRSLAEAAASVFGAKFAESLEPVAESFVTGLVSRALGVGRAEGDRQFFFVNGRPVDLPKLTRAANDAWRRLELKHKPALILDLTVDRSDVDVNLAPDKREVVLDDEDSLVAKLKDLLAALWTKDARVFAPQNRLDSMPAFVPHDPTAASVAPPRDDTAVDSVVEPVVAAPDESDVAQPVVAVADESVSAQPVVAIADESDVAQPVVAIADESDVAQPVVAIADEAVSAQPVVAIADEAVSAQPVVAIADEADAVQHNTVANDDASDAVQPNTVAADDAPQRVSQPIVVDDDDDEADDDDEQRAVAESDDELDAEAMVASTPPGSPRAKKNSPGATSAVPTRPKRQAWLEEVTSKRRKRVTESYGDEETSPAPRRRDDELTLARFGTVGPSRRVVIDPSQPTATRRDAARSSPTLEGATLDAGDEAAREALSKVVSKRDFARMRVIGQFNKGFILARLDDALFIVDQHAADEKYRYEQNWKSPVDTQPLVAPLACFETAADELVVSDRRDAFEANGFRLALDPDADVGDRVKLIALPTAKGVTFSASDARELLTLLADAPPDSTPRLPKLHTLFASKACRSAVMIGDVLDKPKMATLLSHLGDLNQPWNCPPRPPHHAPPHHPRRPRRPHRSTPASPDNATTVVHRRPGLRLPLRTTTLVDHNDVSRDGTTSVTESRRTRPVRAAASRAAETMHAQQHKRRRINDDDDDDDDDEPEADE